MSTYSIIKGADELAHCANGFEGHPGQQHVHQGMQCGIGQIGERAHCGPQEPLGGNSENEGIFEHGAARGWSVFVLSAKRALT